MSEETEAGCGAVGAPVEPSVRPLVECLAGLEAAAENGCQCADNTSWKGDCIEPCAARIATDALVEVGPTIRDALRRALLRSVRLVA